MKVLWFTNTPASGEEYLKTNVVRGGWLKSLDKALKEKVDLHVAFYYPKYAAPFEYKGIHYYPICKFNWKRQILKKLIFGDYVDQEDLPTYLSIIENVHPDIIHIHGSENPFGCMIGKTLIPIVLSIQGNQTVYLHKYFSGIEKKYLTGRQFRISDIKATIFDRSFKQEYCLSKKTQLREVRNLKNCLNIIGRTDWDRRVSRILAPDSLYYHNDEVLRNCFYNSVWEKPKNDHIIIHSTIGVNFFKGLETLSEALYELNLLGLNVEWRVAGISQTNQIITVVKRKLGKKYPSTGLIFLGNLNEEDLVARLLEADTYVMPSHIENSPNNLCEAMIIGMPCIATFAGGTGSLLKDREDGILIQAGDPWSMAGAILELNKNQIIAQKYSINARKNAIYRHDKERIVNDLVNIYTSIIG